MAESITESEPRHTPKMQKIIMKDPPWPIRMGMVVVLFAFIAILAFSTLIYYPVAISYQILTGETRFSGETLTFKIRISGDKKNLIRAKQKVILKLNNKNELHGYVIKTEEDQLNNKTCLATIICDQDINRKNNIEFDLNKHTRLLTIDVSLFKSIGKNVWENMRIK